MSKLACFTFAILAVVSAKLNADDSTLHFGGNQDTKVASLALIDDTDIASHDLIKLRRPPPGTPSVTYLLKSNGHDMSNRIMHLLARQKLPGIKMLSSTDNSLAVTAEMSTQVFVLKKIAEIENPSPQPESKSIIEVVREAFREGEQAHQNDH